MAVSWVYRLQKSQLEDDLRRHQIDGEGSLATLRQRMVSFVRANPRLFGDKPEDGPDYKEDLDRTNDLEAMGEELNQLRRTQAASSHRDPACERFHDIAEEGDPQPASLKTLDQMRKWGCHFDGKNVYAFLERLEELQRAYQFTDQQILKGFPKMLKGDAQLWYRNCAATITSLQELQRSLRAFYLSPGELSHLDRQIYDHNQGPREPIRAYVTTILTLMRRRGGFSEEKTIETLYYNMRAGLRLLIRFSEIGSPNELIQRVEEVEETQAQHARETRTEPRTKMRPQRQPTSTVEPAYSREDCCWRCKQRGHSRINCRKRPRKFCSRCGRDGVLSRDCGCKEPGLAQSVSNPALSNTDNEETRVFIPVGIGGYTLRALVDPGSVCSYVNKKTATLCLRHNWDRQKGNTIALMADGTETRLGEHLSGRMRITNRCFDVRFITMRQMTYDVLLGMDILAPLGLTMTLNGTRIFPPSHASEGACDTEGPIPRGNGFITPDVARTPSPNPPPDCTSETPSSGRTMWHVIAPDGVTVSFPAGTLRYRARVGGKRYFVRMHRGGAIRDCRITDD